LKLKRHSEATGGPIHYVGNKPEVHRERLLAWLAAIEERADAAKAARQEREGALKELRERRGAKQRDYGMHSERRPGARGRAGPPKNSD
jgi:hypothetical protein